MTLSPFEALSLGGSRKRKKEKVLWSMRTKLYRNNPMEVDCYVYNQTLWINIIIYIQTHTLEVDFCLQIQFEIYFFTCENTDLGSRLKSV